MVARPPTPKQSTTTQRSHLHTSHAQLMPMAILLSRPTSMAESRCFGKTALGQSDVWTTGKPRPSFQRPRICDGPHPSLPEAAADPYAAHKGVYGHKHPATGYSRGAKVSPAHPVARLVRPQSAVSDQAEVPVHASLVASYLYAQCRRKANVPTRGKVPWVHRRYLDKTQAILPHQQKIPPRQLGRRSLTVQRRQEEIFRVVNIHLNL